jgi:hypothetical protein
VAAESVLGLPAVWPTLLDNLYVSAWRHAGALRHGTESSDAWNALCNAAIACPTDAARRCAGEAHSR